MAPARPSLAVLGVAGFLVLGSAQALATPAWLVLGTSALALAWRGSLDLQRPFSMVEWAALLWFGVLIASLRLDPSPWLGLTLAVPLLAASLLWCLLTRTNPDRSDATWVTVALAAAFLVQIALVAVAATGLRSGEAAAWTVAAATPWLVEPNDIAWFAAALPLSAAVADRRERAVALILALAYGLACVWLRSRTAAASGVAGLLVYAGLRHGVLASARRAGWMLGTTALLGLALLPFLLRIPSFAARWQLWWAGWQVFLAHPWFGAGWHRFAAAAQPWLAALPARADARVAPWPHNLLVEIAAETGLVGLAASAWLAMAFARAVRARAVAGADRVYFAALSGLAALAVSALVEASLLRLWVWCMGTVLASLVLRPAAPSPDPVSRDLAS